MLLMVVAHWQRKGMPAKPQTKRIHLAQGLTCEQLPPH